MGDRDNVHIVIIPKNDKEKCFICITCIVMYVTLKGSNLQSHNRVVPLRVTVGLLQILLSDCLMVIFSNNLLPKIFV